MDSNVVDLIMNDHREMEHLFDQLLNEPDKRTSLVPVMITLLTAHSRAEESEVYPAAAAEAGIAEDVEHSQMEHVEADELAAAVAAADPNAPDFVEKLTALIDAVTHHVADEESTVLPGMRANLSDRRLDELGQAFLDSRAKYLGDMPADITKAQLERQAANAAVSGAGSMSKSELKSELKAAAAE